MLIPLVTYGSETMIWKEKERSRIRAVQMDNLKRSARYQENGGNPKCTDKAVVQSDEGVFRWFSHMERLENYRIAKRVYLGECAGSHSVGRLWKR